MKRFLLTLLLVLGLSSPALAVTIITGSYTGDNTDSRNIVVSPACAPKLVFIKRNDTTTGTRFLTASMGTNASGQLGGTTQGEADIIQQMNSDGFQVGTSLNVTSGVYRYLAVCDNGAADLAEGTYVGTTSDNRDITIAFQPELVFVFTAANGSDHVWRGATSHSGDSASEFNDFAAAKADRIQAFGATSFQVGQVMNISSVNYYYIAFKGNALGVSTGNFAGNTSDDRNITTTFQPSFVGIKGDSVTRLPAYRYASNSGDESFLESTAAAANIIQAFAATSFQVGTHTAANENTVTMRWFALATVVASSQRRPPLVFE
jgi:hypothetical protein